MFWISDKRTVAWHSAVIVVLWAIALAATNARAANWPQFRGPTGLGYTEETNLPLSWNGKTGEGIAWKAPLPKSDNPYSSPVVWGERVFVTYAINRPIEHHLL